MNKEEIVRRLIILHKNKDKIPEWRYKYIQSLGFSSYYIYQIERLLRNRGIVDENNQINWQKLEEFINKVKEKYL